MQINVDEYRRTMARKDEARWSKALAFMQQRIEEQKAVKLADKDAFRAANFPGGRPPNVHRILETSTGKIITYTIGPERLPKRRRRR